MVDATGNIYFAGYTTALVPLVNALQSNNGGGYHEGFFAKIGTPRCRLPSGQRRRRESDHRAQYLGRNQGFKFSSGYTDLDASDFVNGQMPTQLDGVRVTMNGENTYIYYISPSQVNVLTPPDLAPGPSR